MAATPSPTLIVDGAVSKQGEPTIKYRGIFINDEENFTAWAAAKMDAGKKVGPETYKRVFELLLRLKANFLWPAMHPASDEFNKYPENAQNADLYGIVMGSSHVEMMLRNTTKEWDPWASSHVSNGVKPAYDYSVNPQTIYDFWDARVQANAKYENSYSEGMRGTGDSALVAKNAPTTAEQVTLMDKIFSDQRKILSTRISSNLSSIFQVFTPYKEALTLYNAGLSVADDVTILWTEDNHGYIRQLPNASERMRGGGAGIYYHVSYWGSPTSYLWLPSTPLPLMYEEMSKASATGANRLWLLNVGGIKAHEIPMEFFLQLGWNVGGWDPANIASFVVSQAARDFGAMYAADIAGIVMATYQLNVARRPEFMSKTAFNLVNYGDEGQQRLDAFQALLTSATAISTALPTNKQDAFYELVLYPLRASVYQNQKYIAAAKADLYAQQGRTASVTKYRNLATAAYNTVASDLSAYTTGIGGGKWQYVLNPYSTAGGRPAIEGLPSMASPPPASAQALGVAYEGQTTGTEAVSLAFSAYTQDLRLIDIFTKGSAGFAWTATASPGWIKLSAASGTVTDETRIWASIDWTAVPTGSSTGTITITISAGGASKTINVTVSNPATPVRSSLLGYVEANGYVAIEAEHFSQKMDRGGSTWQVFTQLGRGAGDAVKAMPDLASSVTTDDGTGMMAAIVRHHASSQDACPDPGPSWSPAFRPLYPRGPRTREPCPSPAVGQPAAHLELPRLRTSDRAFWSVLSRVWSRWVDVLVVVKPDTVLRWQRAGFRLFLRWKSRCGNPSERGVAQETRRLIRQMAEANVAWGAPRIHGKLLKLGIDISERSVSRFIPPKPRKPPPHTWRTFLDNHVGSLQACTPSRRKEHSSDRAISSIKTGAGVRGIIPQWLAGRFRGETRWIPGSFGSAGIVEAVPTRPSAFSN